MNNICIYNLSWPIHSISSFLDSPLLKPNKITSYHQNSVTWRGFYQKFPIVAAAWLICTLYECCHNFSHSICSTRGLFHKLFCALRPTFEKLLRGVGRALRRAPNFDRAISMISAQLLWNRPQCRACLFAKSNDS